MNKPIFYKTTFVAPGAQVLGDVKLCDKTSVWHNAVIRGDMAPITVESGSNIQDNCTLHCDKGVELVVGKNVTVGHNAVLHSCVIGDNSLIGMGAVILSGAKVGKNCIVAAGSIVTSKTEIPDGTLFMGSPAKFKRNLNEAEIEANLKNAEEYVKLADEYLNGGERFRFVLSNGLDEKQLESIYALAEKCEKNDGIVYKYNNSMLKSRDCSEMNDVLCYSGTRLVGYLGLFEMMKDCGEIEVTGMTAPDFRNRGIFTKMFNSVKNELNRRKIKTLLFITYAECEEGRKLANKFNAVSEHSEFVMTCKKNEWKMSSKMSLTFRKAVSRDLKEMVYLDMLGFNLSRDEAEGFYKDTPLNGYYIAEYDGKPVGHICILREKKTCLVCGLVVSPMFRRKGYGREILDYALDLIFTDGFNFAKLEVDSTNKVACSLYLAAGFKMMGRYDYFKIEL